MTVIESLQGFFRGVAPYAGVLVGAMVLSLALTPLCRRLATALGMLDRPGPRRINKTPVPRAGGLAIFLAYFITVGVFVHLTGRHMLPNFNNAMFWRFTSLAVMLCAVGFLDDKFSLPPLVKLAGQLGVACGVVFWCGFGFRFVFPSIPLWLDSLLTVFWITGAINAFNLIDGLDGLATGLAAIATMGMAGSLFFIGSPSYTFVHLAFIGACLGFLRYNFNPASVFLGDTGSMFLGFMVSTLPLIARASDSVLVSVGVPLLAMGVPIFDTILAILRRSVRAALVRAGGGVDVGNTHVMGADADHLHHRILRRVSSQRSAALALYGMAGFCVLVGLGAVMLRDRAAALFIVAFVVGAVVVVKDMSRVELWDAGRLAATVAHDAAFPARRRRAAFLVPLYVLADLLVICGVWLFTTAVLEKQITPRALHSSLPLFAVPTFLALVFFRAYRTVWSRAVLSNYIRLIIAVYSGSLATLAAEIFIGVPPSRCVPPVLVFSGTVAVCVSIVRAMRLIVRNVFYALGSARLRDDPSVSRVVVYGAGLRYRSFRREMVRGTGREKRVIVGLIDDDILLRNHFIGGQRVLGTIRDAREALAAVRADAVVIACELAPERLEHVAGVFRACGVRVSYFSFNEKKLD